MFCHAHWLKSVIRDTGIRPVLAGYGERRFESKAFRDLRPSARSGRPCHGWRFNVGWSLRTKRIMELAPSTNFVPASDRRPPMPPPPPVSLICVEDPHLPAAAGLERQLDALYVGLLRFERDAKFDGIAYKAENFRLYIDVSEGPIVRDDMRMLGIVVKSLGETMRALKEAEVEFTRERGLVAGEERLLLLDPAGNWLRIVQSTGIL